MHSLYNQKQKLKIKETDLLKITALILLNDEV